jgi:HlyD family secretion protein
MHRPHLSRGAITAGVVGIVILAVVAYMMRPSVLDVDTAIARRAPMRTSVDEDGRTRVRDRFVITAPVTGRLRRLTLLEGMVIQSGDVIAWIAPLPLDAAARRQAEARLVSARALASEAVVRVRQAREAAEQTRRALQRREALLAAGAISPESREQAVLDSRSRDDELAAAESRARATAAEVEVARAALLGLGSAPSTAIAVRSPARGRVLRLPDASERVIAAGAPIVELGDASALEVVADVLSTDAVRVCPGQEVEIVEWGGERPLRGRVRSVEPAAFTRVSALGVDEQRVNVVIDLMEPAASVGDGYRVEVRIVVWEAPDVLTVPAGALFQSGTDTWSVYTVASGRARQQTVDVGHRTSGAVEILRGLGADDQVVLFPSDQVRDGARVRSRSD